MDGDFFLWVAGVDLSEGRLGLEISKHGVMQDHPRVDDGVGSSSWPVILSMWRACLLA